ncbi:MAG: hypothetical protein ACREM2_09530 [Vulcanimicrobiaceae bacterium]
MDLVRTNRPGRFRPTIPHGDLRPTVIPAAPAGGLFQGWGVRLP